MRPPDLRGSPAQRLPAAIGTFGLAALSGLLVLACSPALGWDWLAWMAFVPLIVALELAKPARAAALGYVAGVSSGLFGYEWLLGTLLRYTTLTPGAAAVSYFGFVAYHAVALALVCGAAARATSLGWPLSLSFCGAFVSIELVFPGFFPWRHGASIHGRTAWIQIADLGGPIAVSALLVITNAAAAELLLRVLLQRRSHVPTVVVAATALVFAPVYGLIRIRSINAEAARASLLRVGVVPSRLRPDATDAQKRAAQRQAVEAVRAHVKDVPLDLLVLGETTMPGRPNVADLPALLEQTFTEPLRTTTVVGAALLDNGKTPPQLTNSALVATRSGQVLRYDKQLLVPFGETLPAPFAPLLSDRFPHVAHFEPGSQDRPVFVNGHTLGLSICYEDIFESHVNELSQARPFELLISISDDSWFGAGAESRFHEALAKFRAVEQRTYLVRATDPSTSAVIDATGRRHALQASPDGVVLLGEAWWYRGRSVFQRAGNGPWWLVSALTLFGLIRRRSARRAPSVESDREI